VRTRWRVPAGVMIAALLSATGAGSVRAATRSEKTGPGSSDGVRVLRIYYRAPVLVKAGEKVTMPVQVVCATEAGRSCDAVVAIGVKSGTGDPWRFHRADAGSNLTFDLTAPAARAASRDQSVSFVIRASSGAVATSLPAGGAGPPIRFYVASGIRTLKVPAIPFGHVRHGRTVLFLPWGSGPIRAGLELGRESPTVGPPSFDVDRAGGVQLLDALQGRVAHFVHGRLARSWRSTAGPGADLALTDGGGTYVADEVGGRVIAKHLSPSGKSLGSISLGSGLLSQVRTVGESAYAEVLPLDAWIRASGSVGSSHSLTPVTGRPLPSGERLLRVGTERYVRLGLVRGGRVHAAVELRGVQPFGEVALAEPDGSGGYVVVVRVWRSTPDPKDQYQVLHVSKGRVVETFATSSRSFAETPPLSRFRLGRDGRVYQLVTSSAGIRIVRFELKEES
jgi:hypothetical protein